MKRDKEAEKEAMQETIQSAIKRWPVVVARKEVSRVTGGAFSTGHMANLDCQGKGPEGAFYLGRAVVYPTEKLISWLEERAELI